MDQATSVEEVGVDRFAGLTFGEACSMLFSECKSNAPASRGFQNMMDFVSGVHQAMGIPFSREEYWNENIISGTHEIFPAALGADLNVVPDEISEGYLDNLIERIGEIEQLNAGYRRVHEEVVSTSRSGSSRRNSHIDISALTRAMNSVPMYLPVNSADDEDDFI